MAQAKLVTKRRDGWYWRLGSSKKYPWMGPFVTEHVATQMRERATGGAWGLPAHGNKRKQDMTTRAFKARRARAVRTRVGSRYRDPTNGQFA